MLTCELLTMMSVSIINSRGFLRRMKQIVFAAVYQCQLSFPSLRGQLTSGSLRGEGLVLLIRAVVILSCCTADLIVRYCEQWT